MQGERIVQRLKAKVLTSPGLCFLKKVWSSEVEEGAAALSSSVDVYS